MDYDPFDLQGQEKRRNRTEQERRLDREQEAADIKWLMGSRRGRRVMHRLLTLTGVYRTSFTGNSQTFFNEGQRNIGLIFTADVHEHCPEDFMKMLAEVREQRERRDDDGTRFS